MKRTINVLLGESARPLGVLRFDAQGTRYSAGFEYHPDWLAAPDRFAIEPGLPLVAGMQFHRRSREGSLFHGAIADTEPDGWGRKLVLRDHAKRRQGARKQAGGTATRALDPLDYLLAVDDVSRVGALRFADADGMFQRAPDLGQRGVPPLIELDHLLRASRAVEMHTETAADLAFLLGRGTSLGGLRPKCSIIDDEGHLAIGKFPSVADDRAVTKGEVLAMRLARDAGIETAAARLLDSDGSPVALIRRFDRPAEGGRLLYISAATMIGADADDATPHTYPELIDALRQHGAEPQADIEALWRRIAFNILITNVDDHLHNHGFLHVQSGRWRLAPAFDLNPFPERARELKTWISEDSGPDASIDALLSVAAYFRLTAATAHRILGEVERAVSMWRNVGRALGMSAHELDAFAEAFEHGERGVGAALGTR
ncbi:MAG: HipA domain-containing protein [Xanthomonadaceae bacterium]|nr:HipA domain-containing protein [Xanthomonadaceae bacterium]MDP2184111.1 HipA domain-containing protein [Xanthomonadales bacterium]MDZ4115875.1 HipA domain-containing protein [Xanthomonadaceae bacterium]MDZ4377208.1 HipA domain-containing protein [Xanthomonadaceae bacterium]